MFKKAKEMSLIVSWIAVDTHGVSSAYIASESRISWSDRHPIDSFDSCRKTFFFKKYPEIVAYCGDVLFPSILISSVIEAIDNGMIFKKEDNAIKRFQRFKKYLFNEFHKYPKQRVTDSFELIYINKDDVSMRYPTFYAYHIRWNRQNGFLSTKISLPEKSELLHVMGSGRIKFEQKYDQFKKRKCGGTSRNIYQCFSHLLLDENDQYFGGAPQLVGLYRKPNTMGFAFGLVHNRKRYYNGLNIGNVISQERINWRNKYFEICEGKTKQRIPGSQIQERDLDI